MSDLELAYISVMVLRRGTNVQCALFAHIEVHVHDECVIHQSLCIVCFVYMINLAHRPCGMGEAGNHFTI